MNIDKVSIGHHPPDDINVIIEVPLGGEPIKYELDKESGALVVDRFLYTATQYPCNYGFVPHTLSDDGDPIDVMCIGNRPLVPGCILNARPVGVLIMEDEAGMDEKIIAVPSQSLTKYYDTVHSYTDLPEIMLHRIAHFFEQYKALEPNKWVKVVKWGDADTARQYIQQSMDHYANES
ncbi:MAG: inorganic diphosphatase [Pseudomonadota bacterium]